MKVRVKICGLTRAADALEAVRLGADALGFIFVPSSPRYVSPERAREIIRVVPPFVTTVGVFIDTPQQDIREIVERTGLSAIQLHGSESPADLHGYTVPVIKAFRVGSTFSPSELASYDAHAFLLDAFVPGQHGGTGQTFDWRHALAAKKFGPVILGGGLTPDNVGEAIAFVGPYAVDVSSGVETAPGVKDLKKLACFFEAVRQA